MKIGGMNMKAFEKWREGRPEVVQRLIDQCMPDTLYRLKTTGQRGSVIGYGEDGTLRLFFPMPLNYDTDLEVFGINPDDLEECDDDSSTFMAQAVIQPLVANG